MLSYDVTDTCNPSLLNLSTCILTGKEMPSESLVPDMFQSYSQKLPPPDGQGTSQFMSMYVHFVGSVNHFLILSFWRDNILARACFCVAC